LLSVAHASVCANVRTQSNISDTCFEWFGYFEIDG
jgi:hypothetical protein